jgi:hypothetical protein
MKGNLAGRLEALTCLSVAAAMLLAGCVVESADVEDEAPPVSTALGFQPDVPKVPALVVPSKQGDGASSGQSSPSTTPPSQASGSSDDSNCSDPEPSPWVPGETPQEAHSK